MFRVGLEGVLVEIESDLTVYKATVGHSERTLGGAWFWPWGIAPR